MMRKFVFALVATLLVIQPSPSYSSPNKAPIILLIDTSGSMKAEKIGAVKDAVSQIINGLQKDQPIEIISFNNRVKTIVQPTTDFALALMQIEKLKGSGTTSMYDAIDVGLSAGDKAPVNQIVLLSDGRDTTSSIKLEKILNRISASGIHINSIGVQVAKPQEEILSNISTISGGQYYAVTDISTLITTYKAILAKELAPAPSVAPTLKNLMEKSSKFGNPLFEISITVIGAILFYLFLSQLYRRQQERKMRLARMQTLEKYSYRRIRKVPSRIKISLTSYAFIPNRVEEVIRKRLETIHSKYSYEKVVQGLIGLWIFLFLFLLLPTHSILVSVILTSALLPVIFNSVTNRIREKQELRFAEELPDLLNILAGALRAGLSLEQGLEAYITDAEGEVAREIRRATSEVRMGTPVDDALKGVADRMNSEDLKWAVTALSIQRVVGGSMATILTTTFETVKSRAEIRREVKTLSAEGKLSAYVLMSLPVGIFLFLAVTRREYVRIFWSDPAGVFLLILIGIALSIGWTWMKKIVEIKI